MGSAIFHNSYRWSFALSLTVLSHDRHQLEMNGVERSLYFPRLPAAKQID